MADKTSSSVGVGQQTPVDANSDYSVMAFIIRQFLAKMDIVKLGRVLTVHPGTGEPPTPGTVDVELLISLLDGNGNSTPAGTVYGLPYIRLAAGGWAIVADPQVGDIGLIVCADRDISAAKAAAAKGADPSVNPASYRKFSVSDGIYIGGLLNARPTRYLWLKDDGYIVLKDKDGNKLESSAAGWAITGKLTVTGDVTAGYGGADAVGLQTHRHSGVQTGGGVTLPPVAGT